MRSRGVRPAAMRPLARRFYAQPPDVVARRLLGCLVVHEGPAGRRVGRIVEVEAYGGARDPASHAFRGPTRRNRSMFGPAGYAYVYLSYGIHHCLNVVTGVDGQPSAVLIRALEPLGGMPPTDGARPRAGRRRDPAGHARGPGRVARALGVTLEHDGADLTRRPLWLAAGALGAGSRIARGPRIGISRGVWRRWRFFVVGHPSVSGPRGRGRPGRRRTAKRAGR